MSKETSSESIATIEEQIEHIAINENNMLNLNQYGLELVKDHLTTLSEVMRVCCN